MAEKRTNLLENGMIWFGAAVSLAELRTGTCFASLGMGRGLAAILLGHLIGGVLLFLAGVIGGQTRKGAMETAGMSFGRLGSCFFALLNILQLVGWTAIMIYDGAHAANAIVHAGVGYWCLLTGCLIVLWLLIGLEKLGRLNAVAMSALLILTVLLCVKLCRTGQHAAVAGEPLGFGAAVELSAAMPLSWLPLIADYTRSAEKPVRASAVSVVIYSLVSSWMYLIGMIAARQTGENGMAGIVMQAGMGIAGLLIVVFSTVTTTFLDVYSAGVSSEALSSRFKGKWVAVAAAVIGTLAAMLYPMDNIEGFLYLIGSVFAPMAAIQITDHFLLHRDSSGMQLNVTRMVIWVLGFVLYRLLMLADLPIGSTLPDMMATALLVVIADRLRRK